MSNTITMNPPAIPNPPQSNNPGNQVAEVKIVDMDIHFFSVLIFSLKWLTALFMAGAILAGTLVVSLGALVLFLQRLGLWPMVSKLGGIVGL
jgi:hypothetical protein